MRIELQEVHYMPKQLEPGILYVSRQFGTAAHLCACGCGAKIRTPLGPTEWSVKKTSAGPSLWPSVGNWQLPCKSHYVIDRGEVEWAPQWNEAQIRAGRAREEHRRAIYYNKSQATALGKPGQLAGWLKKIFGR